MPRAVGIDAGTTTLDLCALDEGEVVLERSWPTAEAMADPAALAAAIGPCDAVVAPSGYGLPLIQAKDASDADLALAFLPDARGGGIGGLRRLVRTLVQTGLPVWLMPGVMHLPSVPAHRKLNRVDLGTPDKLCAAALAIALERPDLSAIVLELGGAFTAAVAIEDGRVVDGIGGSAGPMGAQACGALDAEVALLAGAVTKALLFQGGGATVVAHTGDVGLATHGLVEGAAKAVRQLLVSAPAARTVFVTGRTADDAAIFAAIGRALPGLEVRRLRALGTAAKAGAEGAAVIADGLAGGQYAPLVARLGLREARGTVLDHLHVITPAVARRRLGLE